MNNIYDSNEFKLAIFLFIFLLIFFFWILYNIFFGKNLTVDDQELSKQSTILEVNNYKILYSFDLEFYKFPNINEQDLTDKEMKLLKINIKNKNDILITEIILPLGCIFIDINSGRDIEISNLFINDDYILYARFTSGINYTDLSLLKRLFDIHYIKINFFNGLQFTLYKSKDPFRQFGYLVNNDDDNDIIYEKSYKDFDNSINILEEYILKQNIEDFSIFNNVIINEDTYKDFTDIKIFNFQIIKFILNNLRIIDNNNLQNIPSKELLIDVNQIKDFTNISLPKIKHLFIPNINTEKINKVKNDYLNQKFNYLSDNNKKILAGNLLLPDAYKYKIKYISESEQFNVNIFSLKNGNILNIEDEVEFDESQLILKSKNNEFLSFTSIVYGSGYKIIFQKI